MILTQEILLSALYCTSPTGIWQLNDHLRWRFPQVVFEVTDLVRGLNELIQKERVIRRVHTISQSFQVELYARPGYGIV